ncbi:hypothetical protein OTK49_21660 [Vibrio coralliirubri]|uniref:hypothetical protein n=1 Tax=Vibrio coralliirubri TaxID=1516159 RepID=UPI002284CA12|nr:hypothetical protein [Vibrio coralliirubri]MCY9865130.1 hypothetical protein [Vibrio coralliirubri]
MRKLSNKCRLLSVLIAASTGTSYAAVCPPIGTVQGLVNPTLVLDLQGPGFAHDSYNATIAQQLKIAFGNIQNAVVEQNMQQAETAMLAAEMVSKNQLEIQRISSKMKMDHEGYLAATAAQADAAIAPTGGGDVGDAVNKDYFKRLCAMKKTSDAAFSPSGRSDALKMARSAAGEFEFTARGALLAFEGGSIVKRHYENFCSEEDAKVGLCKEGSKIPNADLLSFVFLYPQNEEGKGVVKEIAMKTEFTYSDFEMKAAKNYIEHMTPLVNLRKPSSGSEFEPNMVAYTAKYNQLQAMVNLSRHAFSKAYQNRVPVVNTESLRLSRLDQIRVILENANNKDIAAATNANAKGKMIFVLNQMALENMLDQEIAELEKLNNDLLAALLAEKNNKPSIIAELTRIKG